MTEENKGFTLGLALVDFIPVLLFGAGAGIINLKLQNTVFLAGIIVCLVAGLGKVLWKIILAFTQKDVRFLFIQMRVLMPLGFIAMVAGIVLSFDRILWRIVFASCLIFPANFFFLLGVIGMLLMCIWAVKLDPNDAKSNWIEQITNIVAQASFLVGIIFAIYAV